MNDQLHLLVVEDNPADADFIHELLPTDGPVNFHIESVARLSLALARLERKGIDLVLLDLGLPDSQGLKTFHQLRQAAPTVPVIVLSGGDDQEMAVAAVGEGAQDYLVKGRVSGNLLSRAIRYALERQRAEAALRLSEQRHRTILRSAMDGYWRVDLQGRLLEVNETYCQMSGYAEAELLAMRISDLEVAETAAGTAAHFQKVITQGADRFESRHRRKDGTEYLVEVSVQYRLEEGGYCVGFLRDITERKRVESERERLIGELKEALAHVKTLTGLVPICSNCKKIRDDKNYWHAVETYIEKHSDATFTHGMCPACIKIFFPGMDEE